MCAYVPVCACMYMRLYVRVCTCACMCAYVYVCVYVRVCTCACTCTCTCQRRVEQYTRHAAPMLPFPRVNGHARGNVWKVVVPALRFVVVAEHQTSAEHQAAPRKAGLVGVAPDLD